jgi:4-hydroxy-tetrahydrodipicolinate reductase
VIGLVIVGAAGRMGRAVCETALAAKSFTIKGCVEPGGSRPAQGGEPPWGPDASAFAGAGDVVIEFGGPEAAASAAILCARVGAALVSGSTGLTEAQEREIRSAAERVAVVRAANFSIGVLVLRRALAAALAAAPPEWDVEIVERHHRAKVDSPSGTALQLARDAAERRGGSPAAYRHGREGRLGPRPSGEIGIHAVRGGSWVGDHAVLLAGPGESIELRHVAQDRGAFAHGAIAAARFVVTAPPGLYTLEHVVNAAIA